MVLQVFCGIQTSNFTSAHELNLEQEFKDYAFEITTSPGGQWVSVAQNRIMDICIWYWCSSKHVAQYPVIPMFQFTHLTFPSMSTAPWWSATWHCGVLPALVRSTWSDCSMTNTCFTWWSTRWPLPRARPRLRWWARWELGLDKGTEYVPVRWRPSAFYLAVLATNLRSMPRLV